jgi:hypothetical protein
MKTFLPLAIALAAASCAGVPSEPTDEDRADLAAELDGRVAAGEPVDCVSHRDLRGNRSVGESYILFESWGNSIYVNTPPAGCPGLRQSRTLITRTPTNRLCRGDIVEVKDLTSNISYGSCALGEFTKYERR